MTTVAEPRAHTSVLLKELLAGLRIVPGGLYVDCTVNGAGHALAVLEASSPGGRLLGIDADPRTIRAAERRLAAHGGAFLLVNDNFANLGETAKHYGFEKVHGVYFDLGLSSTQLEEPGRGFSFQRDDPLDMRFSDRQERTAADLVNGEPEGELVRVLRAYGEEPRSRAIARRIVARRPLHTTGELAQAVQSAVPGPRRRIHPATRTMQAIRIWVNDELANLESALDQAAALLGPGGRIAAVSFHSLEDRLVKSFFRRESSSEEWLPGMPAPEPGGDARLRLITRRVITPSPEEIESNPRSRSGRLRVAERL